ncbi:MAG: MATE family efflux transporter [Verrucomicrobia bacterium]|nr:MATE family efflux transporter [Verrucomicrobiota bacterium]
MSQSTRFQNYLAGVSTGSVRMLLHVLVGLFLTPFTLRYLDREEFAIFSLTLDVLTWLALLDIGITAGLRTQAARLSNLTDTDKINRLASTAFFAQNLIVLVILVLGIAMSFAFPHFFPIRPDLHRDATLMMALSVLGVAVSIGSQTFSALLVANQQMHVDNLIGLLLIVIRTVLTVVLLKLGFGVFSLAIAHVVSRTTTAILAAFRVYRLLPNLRIRYRLASWQDFKQIGGLGIWFSLGGIAGMAIHSMDSAIAAKVVSVEAITALVLTGRFYELTSGLVWLISENARPMLGQMLGQNKMSESLFAYRQLFGISSGLAVVFAFSVWAGNANFIGKWVGDVNYAGPLVDLALAFTIIAGLWNMPNRVILSANLAVRGQCLVRMLEGVVNLSLSVWLGLKYGLIGVVAANFLAALLTSMWLMPLLTARMFKYSFWRFLWDDASRAVLLMIVLFPIAYVARSVAMNISGFGGAFAGATLTGISGLVLGWFMVLDKSVRERVILSRLHVKIYDRAARLLTRSFAR